MTQNTTREVTVEETGPSLFLDDHLCFTLYAASRAVTGIYRPLLSTHDLTYPQYLVLLVLWEHGTVPVKDIVSRLHLDHGTLTPLLKRLEGRGLIGRRRRADDERVVEIALTPEGADLRKKLRAVPPVIGDAMGLEPEEIETVRVLLRKLTANVDRHASPTA
ncbi:MarR family winged helix-turn-helix transcriptional regulator [Streptomyces sp. AC627_RSS907]|uniref:MarR family winged helix-turn-helix transcriptional regulator n=1 Tax=Streptomyces sp. AC627_RSS907 TaxID=2823684 RepID=UPI001C253D00|nr:MarR family transcriptional regulator [Streptomyces sp. AC627_RSS907]